MPTFPSMQHACISSQLLTGFLRAAGMMCEDDMEDCGAGALTNTPLCGRVLGEQLIVGVTAPVGGVFFFRQLSPAVC